MSHVFYLLCDMNIWVFLRVRLPEYYPSMEGRFYHATSRHSLKYANRNSPLVSRDAYPISFHRMMEAIVGQAKAEMMRLQDMRGPATVVALKANAVGHCELHDDMILEVFDDDAEKHAYAIGAAMVEGGEIDGTHQEFMDSIKSVIDEAMNECPLCARYMEQD